MVRLNLAPSPNCPRCGKAVYAAESIIGPAGKSYHKPCLSCIVCKKRLDSTLLLEHEGEAYCRNCHRAHLGQGKGGFGLSVPLQPKLPTSNETVLAGPLPRSGTTSRAAADTAHQRPPDAEASLDPSIPNIRPRARDSEALVTSEEVDSEISDLANYVPRINIAPRARDDAVKDVYLSTNRAQASASANGSSASSQPDAKPARSIDDIIASGVDVPTPISRLASARARGAGPGHPTTAQGKAPVSNVTSGLQHGETIPTSKQAGEASNSAPSQPKGQSLAETSQATTAHAPAPAPTPKPANLSSTANMTITKTAAMSARGEPLIPSSRQSIDGGATSSNGLPAPKRVAPPRASVGKTAPSASAAGTNGGISASSAAIGAVDLSPGRGVRNQGLASSVRAGTPLCARCSKAVYFAEQLTAAGRLWHRACLRCDGCRTTLEPSKLEEGPLGAEVHAAEGEKGCNVWCKTCYKKHFGPKGIGVAGLSLPEAHTSPRR